MPTTKQGTLAKNLLAEYPTAGNLTLAKRLHRDYPEYYETVEHARTVIRYYKGEQGVRNRKDLGDLTHVKDLDKVLADKFALPPSAAPVIEPYILPKAIKNVLVMADLHFPFQNNDAIYRALQFGIKENIDCIIIDGDAIDMYQDSKYPKDSRKPNIDYEIELFYEFLKNLRETFPNVMIIWKFGNHELRYDMYWKTNAPNHYSHATSLDQAVLTPELNVIVVKDDRRIVAGDLEVLHGHELKCGRGSVSPARAIYNKASTSCLVGHFHSASTHRKRRLNGELVRTYSIGSMCMPLEYAIYGDQDNSVALLQIRNGKTFVKIWEL